MLGKTPKVINIIIGEKMRNLVIMLLAVIVFVGCGTIKESSPGRTATEILLISSAAERAVKEYKIDPVIKGKKIFLDDSFYDSVDKKYVVSSLRNHFSAHGIQIVAKDQAEFTVEIRNGTLGIHNSEFGFGIPSIPIGINFGADIPPVKTPELNILARKSAQGWCKVQFWVYDKEQKLVSSSPDLWGSSYYNQWVILFVGPFDTSNDVYPD